MISVATGQPPPRRPTHAFTLIELLVVIAVIGILIAGLGVALSGGGRSSALQNAQSTLNGLLSGARAQAAIHQAEAGVFVDVERTSDGFLRSFQIAYKDSAGLWIPTGDSALLAQGVFLVPPDSNSTITGAILESGWPTVSPKLISTVLTGSNTVTLQNLPGTNNYRPIVLFTMRGTTTVGSPSIGGSGNQIILGPAERLDATTVEFKIADQNQVRGATVSNYGVATLINDASAFQ